MFKDLPEGQTHYENDGCGEPAHNKVKIDKGEKDSLFELAARKYDPKNIGMKVDYIN